MLNNIAKNDERDACPLSLFGKHMQPPSCEMPSAQAECLKQWRTKAHINRAAAPELRTLFYLATWSACKSNKACIELRKKLKNKGKPPKVILIALAHKLLRQVWRVVKNNTDFDNDFEDKAAAA